MEGGQSQGSWKARLLPAGHHEGMQTEQCLHKGSQCLSSGTGFLQGAQEVPVSLLSLYSSSPSIVQPEEEHHQKERKGQRSRKAGMMLKPASYSPSISFQVKLGSSSSGMRRTTLLCYRAPAQATCPGLPNTFWTTFSF